MLAKPLGHINIDAKKVIEYANTHDGQCDTFADVREEQVPNSDYVATNCFLWKWRGEGLNALFPVEELHTILGTISNKPKKLTLYKQGPANFTPPHIDKYYEVYESKESFDNLKRSWIPLENYQTGQVLMCDDFTMTHYKGGDVFVIPTGVTHVGVNASLHERYFITFTSFT